MPLRGVISVRGLLENTWRRFIAMVRRCGMHCAPFDSEAGKALFGQVTTGRKTLAAWMLGPRRPATMTAPSAGSHGLLGGADAVRRKSQGY